MILSVKARKRSADLADDMPNSGDLIQGAQILEFEVPYDGAAPTIVVDCQSKHAFDMFQVRGDTLPRRPCPLRPIGEPAGPEGPPDSWLDQTTGRIKPEVFSTGDPKAPRKPSDLFSVVSMSSCNGCPKASEGTVALKSDQTAIRVAFDKQLKIEDFSSFPDLADEDRDHRRWNIDWGQIEIISE